MGGTLAGAAETGSDTLGSAAAHGRLVAEEKPTAGGDPRNEKAAAELWVAGGAADVILAPINFVKSARSLFSSKSSREERAQAFFDYFAAAGQLGGGAITVASNAMILHGKNTGDRALKERGEDAGWNVGAFLQDFLDTLKNGARTVIETFKAIKGLFSSSDSKSTKTKRFFEAFKSLTDTAKGAVSGARYVLKFLGETVADRLASIGLPIIGLVSGTAHLIIKAWNAIKAYGKRRQMMERQEELAAEVVLANGAAGRSPREKKKAWAARLERLVTTNGPGADKAREILLARLLERVAKKRIVRALTTMPPKLASMLGDILLLSGVGAIGGAAAKAVGTAHEVGQTGLRWLKQKVHDVKGDSKSSKAKQRQYFQSADEIISLYAAMPPSPPRDRINGPWFDQLIKVEGYVKAAGGKPKELYAQHGDLNAAYKMMMKAMRERE